MNLASRLVQRLQGLPTPLTRDLVIERDLRVPMRDGTVLLADRWVPKRGGDGLPTAVVRVPYGRTGFISSQTARPLAERGFQVLVQSTRGTFGSGGRLDPLRCEREDGLDTLEWVVAQPWCGESVVLAGGSYLGGAQWAVASEAPPEVRAMIPAFSESALLLEFIRADGFSLETPFVWGVQIAGQERRFATVRQLLSGKKVERAMRTLPLRDADFAALGHRFDFVQNMLAHDADAPFWTAADHRDRVADITVPASLVGGWYDIFLPGQLRDYRVLHDAGRSPRLTVGPWTHTSFGMSGMASRETIESDWLLLGVNSQCNVPR